MNNIYTVSVDGRKFANADSKARQVIGALIGDYTVDTNGVDDLPKSIAETLAEQLISGNLSANFQSLTVDGEELSAALINNIIQKIQDGTLDAKFNSLTVNGYEISVE